MNNKILITQEGYLAKDRELSELLKLRPDVVDRIKETRVGNLGENQEYIQALEEQDRLEEKINLLNSKLQNYTVVDISKINNDGVVRFGMIVTVIDLDTNEELSYQIVGEDESDAGNSKISYRSPMAKELIGKKVGDEFDVRIPNGWRTLEIKSLKTS